MAERRGFEPPDRFYPINRLAGGCLQPLGHLSRPALAEGVGFEPTEPCGSAVFKTAALNHSAIPPAVSCRNLRWTGPDLKRWAATDGAPLARGDPLATFAAPGHARKSALAGSCEGRRTY